MEPDVPVFLRAAHLWLDYVTLVSQAVLREGLACCWVFFLLILGRKPEPAVHKPTHLSPQPDKDRWIGEGENTLHYIYSFFPVWIDTRFCHEFDSS